MPYQVLPGLLGWTPGVGLVWRVPSGRRDDHFEDQRHRMAVVLAVRGLSRGGAERLVYSQAKYLVEQEVDVEVWYQQGGAFVGELERIGITVRLCTASRARRLLRAAARSAGLLIVHTHSPSFGALLRVAGRGLPVRFIHTEHNYVGSYRWLTKVAHLRTSVWIDYVFAVSQAVLDSAPSAPPSEVLLHVDGRSERMAGCLTQAFKEVGPLRIVCIASLTRKKNHALLFAAMHQVGPELAEDVRIEIVGDGPNRRSVEEAARELCLMNPSVDVRIHGEREDIPRMLCDADLLVLPSSMEGLPLVLLEAMASSTPILATRVGGVPELVDDGNTGVLVEPFDTEGLARSVLELLEDRDLRRALADRARRQLEGMLDIDWQRVYLSKMKELAGSQFDP